MLEPKISQEDLYLYEILKNPALAVEFIKNIDTINDKSIEPFILTEYQKEFACDFNDHVSICCSRAVGKTELLTGLLIWLSIFNVFPTTSKEVSYVVYFVPGQKQLEPVWNNLIRQFRSNSFLKNFIPSNSGVNSSENRVTLLNNAVILCRIAGMSGTGQNVIALHTPFVIFDEAAYFPWNAFIEGQPILNTFTKGYRMFVSGVPNGLRENNVLYHCDQENSIYTKHRVNSFSNPRFSDKDKISAVEQYGGIDSEEYKHNVLGLHGTPVFSIFDRSMMEISPYEVYKLTLNGTILGENVEEYITRIATFPGLPSTARDVLFGIDLGYTEPTAIIILYRDHLGRLKFHGRIQLTKVSYTIQDRFIDLLDTKFKPSILGIDEGSSGKAVIQRLQESIDFIHKDYKKRLIPVNFSSQISLGVDADGTEIKQKAKPFAVSILQDYTNNHKIIYSSTDLELISELERMTYTKNPTGDIVYRTLTPRGGKRGDDHFTSALLCAAMVYYLENESFIPYKKQSRLFSPVWLLG